MSIPQLVACSVPSESNLTAAVIAPFRMLLKPPEPKVIVAGLILIGILYPIVYLALPQGVWNSYNGFKNAAVSAGFTLALFVAIVIIFVALTREAQCKGFAKFKSDLRSGKVSIRDTSAALRSDAVQRIIFQRRGLMGGSNVGGGVLGGGSGNAPGDVQMVPISVVANSA